MRIICLNSCVCMLLIQVLETSNSDVDINPLSPERSRALVVIGGLPIAEYEGSPRRYGVRQSSYSPRQQSPKHSGALISGLPTAQSLLSSPTLLMPRPGFPQRVVQVDANDHEEVK